MFTALLDFVDSARGLQLLLDAALKGAVVLAVALAVAFVLRHASAAARHLMWAVTVTALVLLPLISLVTPEWRVLPFSMRAGEPASVAPTEPASVAQVPEPQTRAQPNVVATTDDRAAGSISTAPSRPRFTLRADQLVLLAWLAGALLTLMVVATGFIRVHLIARRARRITNGVLLAQIAEVATDLDVGAVLALEGGPAAMPMTWGILQAKLLLPSTAHGWPSAKLQAVIRHELAHVRRRDPFWQLIAEAACAVHWFNPLAWHAARQMRIEREHACDDEVLNAGSRASDYASELLDVARSLRSARATSLAAIAMAHPRQLEGRLLAVLDAARDRGNVKRRWPAWLGAVAIVVPIAAVSPRLSNADAAVPILGAEDARTHPAPKVKRPPKRIWRKQPVTQARASMLPNPKAIVRVGQQQDRCSSTDSRSLSINSHSDDDTQKIKWEAGGCKGTLHISGKIRLNGDLTGIASMSPGSDFRLSLDDGRDKRVVTAKPNGGTISYEYTVDGNQRPWSTEGRAWLASALTYVVRHTGFAADERVDYLLKERGPSGVLAEVESMSSDYVQRLYLQKLLAKTTLNGGALESLLATATRTLASDYEMTELLIAVAHRYDFDDASRRAFINGTRTLKSDYEHRRAVSAVLKKGGLSSDDVVAILTSSQAIESDYEKAELLIGIADRYKLDPRMRAAYLTSARNLKSDYEKGRVYKTLLKQGALSGAEAAQVIGAAGTMSSDYERAEVLRLVPASALSDPHMQEAYLQAVTQMKSDYELRRSLMAVLAAEHLSAAALDVVLNAAMKIDSEYERAELLLAVLKRYTLTPAQRNRVVKATDALRSEYERGRVSSALLRQMNSN